MGLDVYAYKNAKLVADPKVSEIDDLIHIYAGHFPDHLCGLQDDTYYDAEICDASYRNGYGGHNAFREMLAKLAGYKPVFIPEPSYSDENFINKDFEYRFPYSASAWKSETGAFKELICFSDCEGVIGTSLCVKLAKDFKDFEEKALSLNEENSDWFIQKYQEFKKVFEAASENGFVEFA